MSGLVGKRVVLLTLIFASTAAAGFDPLSAFRPVPGMRLDRPAEPRKPWAVAGEHGALFGDENGIFEAWLWPVKILSHFQITATLAGYPVPIDVNHLAAEIEVSPAETVITYSHAAFTIRQHMFAPREPAQPETGAVVFFDFAATRPLEVTFSFTPEMLRMWPAPNFGRPSGEWVQDGSSGFYILHTDNPHFSAVVGMPRTHPGILVPYQEHPQTYPLQLKLRFDPARDTGLEFPLILAMTDDQPAREQMARIDSAIPNLYAETQQYYAHFFDSRLTVQTPDKRLNEALRWAEIAIDQMQVSYHGEIGLVAGYYSSGDSARPGFAWFFGRDTLWTTYAINSYGDFALTRRALDFLIRRQRADGKIMHEFSQSADAVDWKATPYFYAEADGTPLFVMAMRDYLKASGDLSYLKANWDAVRKAYAFARAHTTNGIYDNREGTGWVESWPPAMPYQEIYLAALDQQSATAMSELAELMHDEDLARASRLTAHDIAARIEHEFYDPQAQFYAFSRNSEGMLDRTATIFPSVAWWDGTFSLPHAEHMLSRWASAEFSTDWGTRDISDHTSFYDPISYHQGSVWPLFTGWVSMAEYRAGRPLSGYAHLMQNVGLTWSQDLGAVTELLSGEFFQPLGRSTPHQMWSSAMVILPLLRGLFGISWDAPEHTLRVDPHLPAEWDHATLHHLHLGRIDLDLNFQRNGTELIVLAKSASGQQVCLASVCGAEPVLRITSPPIELYTPVKLPLPGATTSRLKVLDEQYGPHQAEFTLAAVGGSTYSLRIRLNVPHVSVQNAVLTGQELSVRFPPGNGYQTRTVRFLW
jgi:glycogen debranching enzyme